MAEKQKASKATDAEGKPKVSMTTDKPTDDNFSGMQIAPEDKVVSSTPLPTINESQESEDAEIDVEHEEWLKMKIRHDKFLKMAHWTSQKNTMSSMSDRIIKHGYYLCLGGAIMTPGEFYVNSLQYWNPLEEMMAKMQKQYELMDKAMDKFAVPWEGHLSPGFIVAARYGKDMEFHRAVNLGLIKEEEYMMQFLDYGDIVLAPIKELRYLPLKFLQKMDFQAIRCTLQFDVSQPWTMEEGEYFRKLIFNKTLAIHFKNNIKLERGAVWEVDVHFYDEKLRKITDFHVERQVFQNGGRKIIYGSPAEDTADKKKVAFAKFNL